MILVLIGATLLIASLIGIWASPPDDPYVVSWETRERLKKRREGT